MWYKKIYWSDISQNNVNITLSENNIKWIEVSVFEQNVKYIEEAIFLKNDSEITIVAEWYLWEIMTEKI